MNQVLPRQRTPDAAVRQRPTLDLSWVSADRLLDRRGARRTEVEDELVAVVQKSPAVDRFVMADRQIVG